MQFRLSSLFAAGRQHGHGRFPERIETGDGDHLAAIQALVNGKRHRIGRRSRQINREPGLHVAAKLKISGGVDFRAGVIDHHRLPWGTEPAATGSKGDCRHGVDGARFQEGRFKILSALAGLLRVMVNALTVGAPEKPMPGGNGKTAVDARGVQRRQNPVDLGAMGERRGALQKHQVFR